jgi:hydroxymethylglutaryl-CoA lyase
VSEPVRIIECPRDAWQGLKRQIPTELKANYLNRLIEAGFRHIDAVSFVSPKAVPQMADSEAVLRRIVPAKGAEIIGIVVNAKGAQRAIATARVTTLGYPCSISETFLRRNQNQSLDENQAVLKGIKEQADRAGLGLVVYISMSFGNPYGDPWEEQTVAGMANDLGALGVDQISVADTAGIADAPLIGRVVESLLHRCPQLEIGVHLHTTRAGARQKILVAYDAGCRRFDSAMGGLGGCPFAQDELVGNVPTEEVLRALEERGIKLPVANSLPAVATMNAQIAADYSAD